MLLDELSTRLTDMSLVAAGYVVVKGTMPASPDKVIALRETGGGPPDVALGGGVVENPAVQVVVRGSPGDYAAPRLVLEAIYQASLTWGAFTASGTRYLNVGALQSPFPLRVDANDRQEVAVNFLAQKELSV